MLILSLNVRNGGRQALPYRSAWMERQQPDLLTLQEVTATTGLRPVLPMGGRVSPP